MANSQIYGLDPDGKYSIAEIKAEITRINADPRLSIMHPLDMCQCPACAAVRKHEKLLTSSSNQAT